MSRSRSSLRRIYVCASNSVALALATICLHGRLPQAATITSPDPVQLAAAIQQGGTVTLAFDGLVTLTNSFVVATNVTLDAQDHSVSLDGGNAVRHFVVTNGATLRLINLTLMNGRFVGASGQSEQSAGNPGMGGSIYVSGGALDLSGCRFLSNKVVGGQGGWFAGVGGFDGWGGGPGLGGAIGAADGQVRVSGCLFSGNSSTGGAGADIPPGGGFAGSGHYGLGGAIYTTNSVLSVSGSTFTNNVAKGGAAGTGGSRPTATGLGGRGGAVAVQEGTSEITRCVLAANQAVGETRFRTGSDTLGGALWHNGGSMIIAATRFEGNTAQGGDGPDTWPYTAVYGDAKGGAVCNSSGTLELRESALINNQAIGGNGGDPGQGLGGALYNDDQISVVNCTAAGNIATGGNGTAAAWWIPDGGASGARAYGGAICSATNSVALLNVTIAANSVQGGADASGAVAPGYGASIAVAGGTVTLTNSIISCLPTQTNVYGAVVDGGHNISSDASTSFTAPGSSNSVDPLLAPLADNGGPTPTMALLPCSPAVDAADDSAAPPTDQRGVGRPCGTHSDIGAFEQVVSEPLRFTSSPQSQTLFVGQTASFYAAVNKMPSYQWQFQGSDLAGATNQLLVLPDLQLSQGGAYSVAAATASGSIRSAPVTLTVLPPAPPVILSQPQSQTVPAGVPASFSVTATNVLALGYQWQHNGTNLPGATATILSFSSTASQDAGNYTVVVSTKYVSVTSATAVLTVLPALPPSILTQPADTNVVEGNTVTFAVAAKSDVPLAYQWSVEGVSIPSAVGDTLRITNASAAWAGSYSVTVSNETGQVTSRSAVLSVRPTLLDREFVPILPAKLGEVAVQEDGKVLVILGVNDISHGNEFASSGPIRLNTDGSVDTSYAWLFAQSLQLIRMPVFAPDRKIIAVVRPTSDQWTVVRLNQDGSADPTFDAAWVPSSWPYGPSSLVVQSDGKVVMSGHRSASDWSPILIRLNQDGSRDASFTPPAFDQFTWLEHVLVQPDGKLVLGLANRAGGLVVRLDSQGVPQSGFYLTVNGGDSPNCLTMQEDGKVLLGGYFLGINDAPVTNLLRVNIDGNVDATFTPALTIGVNALALDESGMIYVGGSGLVCLSTDGIVDPTFQVDTGGGYVERILNRGDGRLIIAGDYVQIDGAPRPGLARVKIPTGVLRIRDWIRIGSMARFAAPTLPDKSYILERSDSINATSWSPVDTTVGDGSNRVLVDRKATALSSFYRVRTP
jgi:uncharacterized delta-60 repeat protein